MQFRVTLNFFACMPNEIIYIYRLNSDCKYHCINHDTPYLAADILRALGFDAIPDCVEFIRCKLDDDKSVWIYPRPRMIKFKFHNLNINVLCTNLPNLWR